MGRGQPGISQTEARAKANCARRDTRQSSAKNCGQSEDEDREGQSDYQEKNSRHIDSGGAKTGRQHTQKSSVHNGDKKSRCQETAGPKARREKTCCQEAGRKKACREKICNQASGCQKNSGQKACCQEASDQKNRSHASKGCERLRDIGQHSSHKCGAKTLEPVRLSGHYCFEMPADAGIFTIYAG